MVQHGRPYPLGARWDGNGTNFAVFSEHAEGVELCVFDEGGKQEVGRHEMIRRTGSVWSTYVEGVGPGTPYGFRIDGRYEPDRGHRFNGAKLLLDPYARALVGEVDWSHPLLDYEPTDDFETLAPDCRDNAAGMPKSLVIDESFDWGDDRRPRRPLAESIICEAHVKGITALRDDVPSDLRGTYRGLTHPSVIAHLQRLGVTAIELLPIHAFVDDEFLVEKGFRQYWGYNTIGFFAPAARYRSTTEPGSEVREFKEMVKALHAAGIEVLLDVVYNHTAEGGFLGPSFSFRGIDNLAYYRLAQDDPRHYENWPGTGNTINATHPRVLQLIVDSLRYWVEEMRVDGFRFDLAPVLGRDPFDFDRGAAFFDIVRQDPVFAHAGTKFIAEPWDLGNNGYQLGAFPEGWSEWNDRFRDTLRGFWLGHGAGLSELSRRIAGSSDVFDHSNRDATATVNFVTAHDGFTLSDLVSYDAKHNEENGENNNDGHDHNLSANHGAEGATDDVAIRALRVRQRKNLLATLLISRGVPMFCAGDDVGHSQGGNNNAYCQDNEIGWIDWTVDDPASEVGGFIADVVRFRSQQPAMSRVAYRDIRDAERGESQGLSWFNPAGVPMSIEDWQNSALKAMAIRYDSRHREEEREDDLLIVLNGGSEAIDIKLPGTVDAANVTWKQVITTADVAASEETEHASGAVLTVQDRSMSIFVRS